MLFLWYPKCTTFGKEALRDVPEDEFYARLGEVRQAAGDRAVLRAIHVYEDMAIGRAISLLLSGLGVLASLTSPSVFVLPSIPKIFCTAISVLACTPVSRIRVRSS